jgi:hypothetical protein
MDGAFASSDGHIGRYEVVRRIGVGGMGEVYLARANGPGGIAKQVCIKRSLPGRAMDPGSVERFLDEARTVLSLQHANVVPVFDFGRDEAGLFLVMEWIDGCDLGALLGAPLPPLVAAHVAAELSKALAYAHERTDARGRPAGLLHCDVTPGNVLVSRLGEVRLTDFGIARATTDAGRGAGTPAYMAPEAASGSVDARSDLYSLGLVLGEMLLGTQLRPARGREEARHPAVIPAFAGVPPQIAAVVRRLLAPAPKDRFPSAAAVHTALLPALAADVLSGGTPPAQQLARLVSTVAAPRQEAVRGASTEAGLTRGENSLEERPERRRWPWVAAAGVAALAISGLLVWARSPPAPVPVSPVGTAPAPLPVKQGETAPAPVMPEAPRATEVVASDPVRPVVRPRLAPGRLRIKSPGSWVAVWIDGDKRADDAGEFEVAAGKHRVRVENPPLHFRQERSVVVHPGDVVELSFRPLR